MQITEEHAVKRVRRIIRIITTRYSDIISEASFTGQHEKLDGWHRLLAFYSQFIPGHVN